MAIANIPLYKGNIHNDPKRIVIHAMGEFIEYENGEHVHAYELLRKLGYSAHRLITPSGDVIKLREDTQGAYHAKGHNTNTLGVEFLVPGVHDYESFLAALKTPYMTPSQFKMGVTVVKAWMIRWDIELEDVVTHSEIDPSRKYDPGTGFPLEEFKDELI